MSKRTIVLVILCFVMSGGIATALEKLQITNSEQQFAEMDVRELIQWMGDARWGQKAEWAVSKRLFAAGSDPESNVTQVISETWKAAIEEKQRAERLEKKCHSMLYFIQHPIIIAYYTNQLLNGSTERERCSAAFQLGEMGIRGASPALGESAVPALEEAIRAAHARRAKSGQRVSLDSDKVEDSAMEALGFMGPAAAPALHRLWKSGCKNRFIIGAMCHTKDKSFVPVFLEVLENENIEEYLRKRAAIQMGIMGDESALPTLRKYREDPSEIVRTAVLKAIEEIEKCQAEKKASGNDASNQPAVPSASPPE